MSRALYAAAALALLAAVPAPAGGLFSPPDLLQAAKTNDSGLARDAILRGDDADVEDEDHKTPLIIAAEHGYRRIVELLLTAKRIQPDHRDTEGKSALFWAADTGHADIVRALIGHGANVDQPAKLGVTPLMVAASHGDEDVVAALLSGGANPARADYSGRDALGWAQDSHNPRVLGQLTNRH